MAAKGTVEKQKINDIIIELFKGSFVNGKEIRIPCIDSDGNEIQIKLNLVTASSNVERPDGEGSPSTPTPTSKQYSEPSEEELASIIDMISSL